MTQFTLRPRVSISRPGSTPSINFRGRGNLGTSSPLYVIDGAIADADLFSNLGSNRIETISFLKDSSSSAIYGSRAAYGIVLVTTKRGQKEKMNVSYSGYVGLKMPTYLPDVLDSWDYATLLNEAFYNRDASNGKNAAYSEDEIKWFRDGSKPANEKLGWETVALTNIGVDFDIFNGLLSLTADYYVKNTSDILLSYNVPLETGIWSNPSQNIAKIRVCSATRKCRMGECH